MLHAEFESAGFALWRVPIKVVARLGTPFVGTNEGVADKPMASQQHRGSRIDFMLVADSPGQPRTVSAWWG